MWQQGDIFIEGKASDMKLLITGGAGFIGCNFLLYMRKTHPEYDLICVDKLTYAGNIESLMPIMDLPKFQFVKADIADQEAIDQIFQQERPDVVVNFAAESHVDRSIENPAIFLESNVIGVQVLLDACRKYGVKRFHQVSTDEVYGDLPLERPDLLFSEDSPLRPSSPYAASKASADLLCLAYYRTYGLPVTISRCSNNYGPYQYPEKLIPLMIANAMEDNPLPVYGRGENIRDWLYVEDHCSAIDLILQKGIAGKLYNIGGNNEVRNIDLVKQLCRLLGKTENLITFVEDRKGHDLRYAINSQRIQNELGWCPRVDLETGIKKTVCWYLDNRQWWSVIKGKVLSS